MNINLKGKIALITGASAGLGEQFAKCLSQAGARIILAGRNIESLTALASTLPNSLAVHLDISEVDAVSEVFKTFEKNNEIIDTCINNAGIFEPTPIFSEEGEYCVKKIFETNVFGTWYVTKQIANHMRNHKINGSIINIGSVNGDKMIGDVMSAYCASKSAVMQMTKCLVSSLATHNIRINCVNPGIFKTERLPRNEETRNIIPLKFLALPSDLDGIILYLSSNEMSRYVTGSVFTIDGGLSCME